MRSQVNARRTPGADEKLDIDEPLSHVADRRLHKKYKEDRGDGPGPPDGPGGAPHPAGVG